jgi:hypothetical protein
VTLVIINPTFSSRAADGASTARMIAFTGLPPQGAVKDTQA